MGSLSFQEAKVLRAHELSWLIMGAAATTILFGFLLDLLLGDPQYPLHPIRIMGRLICSSKRSLRRYGLGGKMGGVVLVLWVQGFFLTAYLTGNIVLQHLWGPLGVGFDLFVCYSCLALKDLINHIRPVVRALEAEDMRRAREAISRVVGRDVSQLDREGLSRAAVETLAENFVDGFLSPVFWYVTGGILASLFGLPPVKWALCFMLGFKVQSTLDSMVGYKNKEYADFGWAPARGDDLMNFIPARLSLLILWAGARFCGLDPSWGLRTALRDRLKHDSPNSAHAESFVAGALHVRLGGPYRDAEGERNKPWLGAGNPDPGPVHVRRTVFLLKWAGWITVAMGTCILIVIR